MHLLNMRSNVESRFNCWSTTTFGALANIKQLLPVGKHRACPMCRSVQRMLEASSISANKIQYKRCKNLGQSKVLRRRSVSRMKLGNPMQSMCHACPSLYSSCPVLHMSVSHTGNTGLHLCGSLIVQSGDSLGAEVCRLPQRQTKRIMVLFSKHLHFLALHHFQVTVPSCRVQKLSCHLVL